MTLTTIDTVDAAPIGSQWQTETGALWEVISHRGEYVNLSRIGCACNRPCRCKGDSYIWHVSTLTQTPAKRVK